MGVTAQDPGNGGSIGDACQGNPAVDTKDRTSSTTRATATTEPEKEAQGATSTPSQWLGGTAGPDPMALLAGGMAQLQAAMLSQLKDKAKDRDEDRSPEAVKPGSSVLPSLPELNQQTSSVDIMDWLEVITTTMQDLSDGSAEWWTRVRALANEAYSRWTSASPVEKLSIFPPREEALESGKWSRVNSRAASMVLMALPDAVKQEMVQRRSTGSVSSLLFRLLTLYQPGGQQEKVTLLQGLQQPKNEQNAVDAVKSLRAWARWLRRCKELEVAAPDPSLLMRGLSLITRAVLEKEPEVSFRTSLVKSHLQVDTKPSYETVEKFYHHLLAECETLAISSATMVVSSTLSTTTPPLKPDPKMKPMKPERPNSTPTTTTPNAATANGSRSPSASTTRSDGEQSDKNQEDRSKVPCKFFGKTYKGCARAARCPFMHSWEGIEKVGRCLACGGKNHSAKECPHKKPPAGGDQPTTATSGGKPQGPKSPTTSTTLNGTSNKNVRIDDTPQVETIPARSSSAPSSSIEANDLKDVLADVGKMLKAMSATSIRSMRVDETNSENAQENVMKRVMDHISEIEGDTGLLDSGASHPMRPAPEAEYNHGQPVRVTLAGEDIKVLMQNSQGTILVQEESTAIQPIVPLGAVIEKLGYTLHWSPRTLRLTHPEKKPIKVKIKNHCPEVAASDALDLIRELELSHVRALNESVEGLKARLEMIKKEERREWTELLKEFAKTGVKSTLLKVVLASPITKDLPYEVQSALVEGFELQDGEKYLKALPLTRRRRRSLLASRNWVVNLFSGNGELADDPFDTLTKEGKVVLNVDKLKSKHWDLHREKGVYQLLLWAAATGRISDIISAPPCQTWPVISTPHRGPEAYPYRTTTEPYGIKDLTTAQARSTDLETATVAKQMILWLLAQISSPREVGFFIELPADCERLQNDRGVKASLWTTEMWKNFQSIATMPVVSFFMGRYGHRSRRPATMATNYPSLQLLGNHYECPERCAPSTLLNYDELRLWSRGFKEILADAIKDYQPGSWQNEEELMEAGVKLHKITREQREAWHRHLFNDHQPYRADCAVCINAQATGYQHRRRAHPKMYTMALDLAGPFKQKGRDMEHDDYKYLMVAAYRCPREYLSVKAAKDLEMDLYVPDDPCATGDEDPMEMVSQPVGGEDPAVSDEEEECEEGKPLGPETLDDAVEGLLQPSEWTTVYVTRPLRGRTNHYVVQAAKEIHLQLKQTGLHVDIVHTDRAREFKAKAFKDWTTEAQLRHTKTAGGDPAGNSSAELGIKWAKARVRALLAAAKAPPRDWPMAIQHASADLWAKSFPDSPLCTPPATSFGNEVWFRSKHYKGKQEKKHEAAGSRWKRGWYRGPAQDVARGHVLVRDDGGLTIAKSVKFDVINPEEEFRGILSPAVASGLPEEVLVPEDSPKVADVKAEIEFRSRKLLEGRDYSMEAVVQIYQLMELLGNTDTRIGKKGRATSWYTGAFVHGGVAGTRANMKEFPQTTKYLTSFAKYHCGDVRFSALGLAQNAQLGLHRDSHNYHLSKNYVLPLKDFTGGSLWIQQDEVEDEECVEKMLVNGKTIRGVSYDMVKGRVIEFSPRRWHEVQPWEGERLVLLLYTPRATKLTSDDVEALNEAGFNVDPEALSADEEEINVQDVDLEESAPALQAKTLRLEGNASARGVPAFEEIEDSDIFTASNLGGSVPAGLDYRAALKKAEVQYTDNIEHLLSELKKSKKPLEVTHNVSLNEVKKNIDLWKASALKEFTNLRDVKKAFTVKNRSELPPGCRLVPCKGVYTVKPDKNDEGYRRKTRFVACGNHVPENENTCDLFAAGVDATSLRTLLSVHGHKPWRIGTTDVRQAFVLAKWLGLPVALEPPTIAYQLGLASSGEVWFVEQAIYGLRESPALWSNFRDRELALAKWTASINDEEIPMKLEQLVSDNQVWRVVSDDAEKRLYGHIVVYIDDLLIHSQEEAMHGFFNWVSTKWEVDALDVLDYDHPIRFLGMEMHRTLKGVELSQEGFVNEILRAHNHKGGRSQSQGPRETLLLSDEEERAIIDAEPAAIDPKCPEVKEAQRRVGELLWLVGRTRPDLQHTVSIMAARITRCPAMVNRLGERLLDYLNETKHYRLTLGQEEEEEIEELSVFTDSSFAPSGGRSQGAAAVFYGQSPLVWRSGRQQLVTLSTAESELVEAVEGATLGLSTRGLLTELLGRELSLTVWVDNSAAISLLTTSSGSWRTRHLRLRSNWVREMVANKQLAIKYVPGEKQRADLGTKPFTRDRLRQLVAMWGIRDQRPTAEVRQARVAETTWLHRLLLLCQVCGSAAQKQDIRAEIPWDLYLAVIVLGIAIIGLWEGTKHCLCPREARVKTLRAASQASRTKLTRQELKELQSLLSCDPKDLSVEKRERLYDLKEKFDETMPPECSPVPRFPTGDDDDDDAVSTDPVMTSSSSSASRNKQPIRKTFKDQSTQADYEPAFTRVPPAPLPTREVISGPFFQVPGRDHLHIYRECWGLRHAGRVERVTLCRCCLENGGNRIY